MRKEQIASKARFPRQFRWSLLEITWGKTNKSMNDETYGFLQIEFVGDKIFSFLEVPHYPGTIGRQFCCFYISSFLSLPQPFTD